MGLVAAALLLAVVGVVGFEGLAQAVPSKEVGTPPVSTVMSFSLRGVPRAQRTLDDLKALGASHDIRVHEPYESNPATFRAVAFTRVLDDVYGVGWRAEEELLLTCRDGYQPSIPVSRLLEHEAWLAFDRDSDEGFTILKLESGESRRVDLSPYYLVWDNLDDPVLLQEGDYGWPYQLVSVDLIRTAERFPNMVPGLEPSGEVAAGFAAFRVHCTRCHKINDEGGGIGPELNSPVNPFDYRDRDWLRAWLDDPAAIVASARMPALNRELPDRARVMDEILAYLQAMQQHKLGAAIEPQAGDTDSDGDL